ncbi:MAG: threonine--tRNA ligase [Candidatus Spechtbacteria bacterium SB0662_bin_43]|uniref:Threonine--tRNA ligase n=1 Tax=Candidatus Spechtbacteria bacterium SB0662_bin_43 TaxID=2604897 RepID=A0A845D9M3_9BACT|nr:threonine--tRNA ligase [Candidatus Spechtbacteria bacterium SB0662_bin_43]
MTTPSSLDNIRHTLAHILAQAVQHHYPDAHITIGPTTKDGFYYDFANVTIPDTALKDIETTMKKILQQNLAMRYEEWDVKKAKTYFTEHNQPYKIELVGELESAGKTTVGVVHTGDQFTDLCQGGHANTTKEIDANAFSLLRVSGAYWRGDEANTMLTRVYGVAFSTPQDLKQYYANQEEAKKRDHRVLGKRLDLFTFSPLVGSGLPLFTPKGTLLRETLLAYLWELSQQYGYEKVTIPHITKIDLYEKSGHADKFRDEFFTVHGSQSNQNFVLKPMNCPHHTQIYASKPRSFRELPLRFTETTVQYRDEKPGELLGLSRVRAFNVDDAHIFCTKEHIRQEVSNIVRIIHSFYKTLGMWNKDTFWVSLSVRDPKHPENYLGTDENWTVAEQCLQEVSTEHNLNAEKKEGEAAFYGPKLDFMFQDALGREWQLATAQIDFVQPERFNLEYTDTNGKKQTAVIIHRAIAGSLERFLSILIEHFGGAFPVWLSPEHVWVVPISEKYNEYAQEIHKELVQKNIRSVCHTENEALGKKIRNGETQKIPYLLIVGEKEQKERTVSVRSTRTNTNTTTSLENFISSTQTEIEKRQYE